MIEYRKHLLDNGLTLITHEADDTPLATVNMLYNVGSRDEDPQHTGFAHLFEHLMFSGTQRFPDFDSVVNTLGGENNAFTNNDYTNYYITLPADSLSTALALEADRLNNFVLTQEALEVQQDVVTDEYKQRFLNQPYGDMWLLLRSLCYTRYPYRWSPIGADIRHVGEATLQEVQAFHGRYYRPDNAILAVAAPLSHEEMLHRVEDVFEASLDTHATASRKFATEREYEAEPQQLQPRRLEVERDVPSDAIYLAWPMGDRWDPLFCASDLVSDVLSNGKSSRLYSKYIRSGQLVTEVDAYLSADAGPGLFIMSAKPRAGVDVETVVETLRKEARLLVDERVTEKEMKKALNKNAFDFSCTQYHASDRALSLCYYTWLGDTDLINRRAENYDTVTPEVLQRAASEIFREESENLLIIRKK